MAGKVTNVVSLPLWPGAESLSNPLPSIRFERVRQQTAHHLREIHYIVENGHIGGQWHAGPYLAALVGLALSHFNLGNLQEAIDESKQVIAAAGDAANLLVVRIRPFLP